MLVCVITAVTAGGLSMCTYLVPFQCQWEGFMWLGSEAITYLAEEVEMG